ncbi:eukaryotic translation initiation factor 2D [Pundamilia nyererei]|uniref:Eukaryotic translation initiation factor 2D n=1 Tax=Pundamilia nyererei TaxID=303518 RepID=A0A9Y3RJ92_9CICH|nr:PREDICTED: eukaryotic translation initiation factor 2D [Pundamilia nyererei]
MFAKPFRVKSNTAIKGSDRRKLKADLSAAFPLLSADELSELVPNKEELNVLKSYAHKGDAVTVYVLHKNPVFFEVDKKLFPTVYVLWRYPALLPAFKTWPPVLQKLTGGADLMLPGVVVPSCGLPDVKQGDSCAVTLVNNRAPVAVGTAAVSTEQMHCLGMKGRGVCILHTYMDYLWAFGDKSGPPSLPDAESEAHGENGEECEISDKEEEEVDKCVEEQHSPEETVTDQAQSCFEELSLVEQDEEKGEKNNEEEEETQDEQKTPQEVMDAMLLRSFSFPEDTDVESTPLPDGEEGEIPYHPPEITTLYSVSARLEPLFLNANKRKGATLHPAEVRSIVTEYVKDNELVDENNKNYVTINPTLCDCLLEKSEYQEVVSLKWDDLFSRTLGRMQECYQAVFPGQPPIVKKGHIEPIDITVASRGSNKKVTLMKNLEVYGLDPAVVASVLQHRVQASSVLQPVPGAKDRVLVQIQGNQIQQVGKLLLDHYQIPRKYIQGLEKAPKGGKKK